MDMLALRVTADFEPKIKDELIAVEDIQDSVEKVLSEAGYADVAKAYILYRKQREKVRNVNSTLLNYKDLVDNYLQINDWRVKENSTVTYSVGGLILSNSGAITANYWLSEIYDHEVAEAHRNADMHLHDLSHAHRLLCRLEPEAADPGGSGRRARQDHLLPGQPSVHPVQPDGELPGHHAERVGGRPGVLLLRYLSGSLCQGGQPDPEGGQAVHPVLRLRRQHPLPLGHPGALLQHHPGLDGAPAIWQICPPSWAARSSDFTYGDCKKEMDMVNKAFIEIMIEGDANGRGFQYPIPTYSITRDFDWSETREQPACCSR